jgi:hypothetical protein
MHPDQTADLNPDHDHAGNEQQIERAPDDRRHAAPDAGGHALHVDVKHVVHRRDDEASDGAAIPAPCVLGQARAWILRLSRDPAPGFER